LDLEGSLNEGELEDRQVVDRQFFEAREYAAAFLEPSDAALDDGSTPVGRAVEIFLLVGLLILATRDHGLDTPLAKPATDPFDAVCLVPCETTRSVARVGGGSRQTKGVEHVEEEGGLVRLTGTHFDGQRVTMAVRHEMDLGAETAA